MKKMTAFGSAPEKIDTHLYFLSRVRNWTREQTDKVGDVIRPAVNLAKDSVKVLANEVVSPVEAITGKNFYDPNYQTGIGQKIGDISNLKAKGTSGLTRGVTDGLTGGMASQVGGLAGGFLPETKDERAAREQREQQQKLAAESQAAVEERKKLEGQLQVQDAVKAALAQQMASQQMASQAGGNSQQKSSEDKSTDDKKKKIWIAAGIGGAVAIVGIIVWLAGRK